VSVFADSSALVKLYADEPGHEVVRALPVLIISQIARVEVPAAIWRKHRMGELDQSAAAVLTAEFEADYHGTAHEPPRFIAVVTSAVVYEAAVRVARLHGLRAYDSVQLASALLAAEADPECREFAAYDKQLRSSASAEGFALIPA
jgi:predicted nucleic acid-binding protein